MEENIKNIASEVNEELIKLFGGNLVKLRTKKITKKRKEISRIASRVGLKNDIMISLLARNCADYENQMKYQPFYQNIEKEGMKIYG